MGRLHYRHGTDLLVLSQRPDGRWVFTYRRETMGSWDSPITAIDHIRSGSTGHHGWDTRADAQDVPDDLRVWSPAPA
ncbi:hypothetical protein [Muricoccus radiodurans]|uniref:hypothetical protein n=1 Tax=Muricoccus radiodurans TaxID=2231721 RepID=UPI003CF8E679